MKKTNLVISDCPGSFESSVIPAQAGIHHSVIPAKAGIQKFGSPIKTFGDDAFGVTWIPAFAGMTTWVVAVISIFVMCRAAFGAFPDNTASAPYMMEPKTQMEKAIEQKVQAVLDEMLGRGRSRIVVNITLDPRRVESVTIKPQEGDQKQAPAYLWKDSKKLAPFLMPGFTMEGEMASPNVQGPIDYVRSYIPPSSPVIQKIDATVMVDEKLNPALVSDMKANVAKLLELNPRRGDTLTVIPTPFLAPWRQVFWSPSFQLKMWATLFFALLGLVALYLMARVVLAVARILSAYHPEARIRPMPMAIRPLSAREALEESKMLLLPEASDEKKAQEGAEKKADGQKSEPFGVTLQNLDYVAQFLKKESPTTICYVLSTLSREMAQEILERLPSTARAAAMKQFGSPLVLKAQAKERIEEKLKDFLARYVDLPAHLQELFITASPEVQEEILAGLKETQPKLVEALAKSAIRVEDLAKLSADDRVMLMTGLPPESAALAMREVTPEVRNAMMSPLPKGWRALIQQHINLNGSHTPTDFKRARRALIAHAFKLMQEGKIRINK